MDPKTNVAEQIEIARRIVEVRDGKLAISHDQAETDAYLAGQADELANLVLSLHDETYRH